MFWNVSPLAFSSVKYSPFTGEQLRDLVGGEKAKEKKSGQSQGCVIFGWFISLISQVKRSQRQSTAVQRLALHVQTLT